MNKTDAHKELNEAYAQIVSIAYQIGMTAATVERIKEEWRFMATMIDSKDINLQNVESVVK